MVVYKAEDNHALSPLADLKYFMVKVVGPAPEKFCSQLFLQKVYNSIGVHLIPVQMPKDIIFIEG